MNIASIFSSHMVFAADKHFTYTETQKSTARLLSGSAQAVEKPDSVSSINRVFLLQQQTLALFSLRIWYKSAYL